jgi:hypothetical protein
MGTDVGALYVFEQTTGQPDSWAPGGRILASDSQWSPIGCGTVAAISDLTTTTGRPEYTSAPLDGVAYLNELSSPLFRDGFESGNTSAWTSQVP